MNIFLLSFFISCNIFYSCFTETVKAEKDIVLNKEKKDDSSLKLLDKTMATIYHPEGTIVKCLSDIRPGLNELPRTLDDVIFEELALLDARMLRINISEEDIDRYLAQLKKQAGYTDAQIAQSFAQLGLTVEQGKEEIRRMQAIQEVTGYRIRDQQQVLVAPKAVERYCEENPQYQEPIYKISQSIFAFNKSKDKAENLKKLGDIIKSGEIDYITTWDEPIEIKLSEISKAQQMITDMKEKEVKVLKETEDGAILIKLVSKTEKRLLSFEERKIEVESFLRAQKYFELAQNYRDDLFAKTKIKYH